MADKPDPTQKLGPTLQAARQKLGLSLRQLGERLRKEDGSPFSPQYLNDFEHGRRIPPKDLLERLARVLDLDFEMLDQLIVREPPEVKEYLSEMPAQSESIGKLFRKAKERGFTDWDRVLKQIEGKK